MCFVCARALQASNANLLAQPVSSTCNCPCRRIRRCRSTAATPRCPLATCGSRRRPRLAPAAPPTPTPTPASTTTPGERRSARQQHGSSTAAAGGRCAVPKAFAFGTGAVEPAGILARHSKVDPVGLLAMPAWCRQDRRQTQQWWSTASCCDSTTSVARARRVPPLRQGQGRAPGRLPLLWGRSGLTRHCAPKAGGQF